MEQTRYVNVRDLSPLQRELTGLPFGLYSEENEFLKKLFVYVERFNHSEDKGEILFVLHGRYELMMQNAYSLAYNLMREEKDVRILNQLSPVIDGAYDTKFQLLQSEIAVDIDDSTVRYKQPGLIFILGEDNQTWIKTALRVGQQEETSESTAEPPNVSRQNPDKSKRNMRYVAFTE